MIDLPILLEKMAGWHDGDEIVGSNTVSWSAYREAEKVNTLEFQAKLFHFIDNTTDSILRKHGYEVLTYLFKNTKDMDLGNKLLDRLKSEDKNDEALYILLTGLGESTVNMDGDIENVIFYVDDTRALIRNAAIRLLANFTNQREVAIAALEDVVENHYDEYDLRYAKESIKKLAD